MKLNEKQKEKLAKIAAGISPIVVKYSLEAVVANATDVKIIRAARRKLIAAEKALDKMLAIFAPQKAA